MFRLSIPNQNPLSRTRRGISNDYSLLFLTSSPPSLVSLLLFCDIFLLLP